MSPLAEQELLLSAALAGDASALGLLLDSYRGRLLNTVESNIHGPLQRRIDASDVVQAACVQAVKSFEQFRGETLAEFWAWLEQVEQNMLIDLVRNHTAQRRDAGIERSSERPREAIGRATTASQQMMRGERRRELQAAIAQLPDGQRQAVELRYLRELKVAEIAQELARTEEAVAGLLKRGVRTLKAILQDRSL